jgi:hypothetical protein
MIGQGPAGQMPQQQPAGQMGGAGGNNQITQALRQIMQVVSMIAKRVEALEQRVGSAQPQQMPEQPQRQGSFAGNLAERTMQK